MLQNILKNRLNTSGIVFVLYLLPILLLIAYNYNSVKSWTTFSLSLLAASAGTFAMYSILVAWQQSAKRRARQLGRQNEQQVLSQPMENSEKQAQILEDMHLLDKELQHLRDEFAQLSQQKTDLLEEYRSHKDTCQEEIQNKKVMLNEYQETISEQRLVIEKKQSAIQELESKLKERDYELKTLLQLSDIGNDSHSPKSDPITEAEPLSESQQSSTETQVKTPEAASQLLKRCINAAQKITGASHFGNDAPLFRDFQINNYALDLRRLFDTLRSENSSAVIVFSPKENKILFANQPIKDLLGWNPDKFSQDFFHLIEEGHEEWKEAARSAIQEEKRIRLLLKSRAAQSKLLHCHLRAIPTGLFRGHMIGIMYI